MVKQLPIEVNQGIFGTKSQDITGLVQFEQRSVDVAARRSLRIAVISSDCRQFHGG